MKLVKDLKTKWDGLDPKMQRTYMIIGILFLLVVVAVILNDSRQKDRKVENAQKANEKVQKTRVVSPSVSEVGLDDLSGQTQSQIDLQKRQLSEILTASKELRHDTAVKTESLKQNYSELAQGLAQVQDEIRVMRLGQEGSPVNEVGGVKLPALAGIDTGLDGEDGSGDEVDGANSDALNATYDSKGLTPAQQAAGGATPPSSVTPDEMIHPTAQPAVAALTVTKKSGDAAKNAASGGIVDKDRSKSLNEKGIQQRILDSHMLTTGSMIEGVLISGMDAATGRGQSSPVPALVRVKKNAILPNRYAQDVRECFILVSGVGDLARERALIRTEKISCIYKDGRVLDTAISGYVVGEDGKAGLRGRVVSKQGSIIAKSVFASFLEGFGSSLKPSSVNSLDISGQSSTQYQQAQLSDAMEAGSYDGLSDGFKRVADYYLDLAEQMFPIIEIDAGRKITVILTNRLDAKFTTVDAVKSTQGR